LPIDGRLDLTHVPKHYRLAMASHRPPSQDSRSNSERLVGCKRKPSSNFFEHEKPWLLDLVRSVPRRAEEGRVFCLSLSPAVAWLILLLMAKSLRVERPTCFKSEFHFRDRRRGPETGAAGGCAAYVPLLDCVGAPPWVPAPRCASLHPRSKRLASAMGINGKRRNDWRHRLKNLECAV